MMTENQIEPVEVHREVDVGLRVETSEHTLTWEDGRRVIHLADRIYDTNCSHPNLSSPSTHIIEEIYSLH